MINNVDVATVQKPKNIQKHKLMGNLFVLSTAYSNSPRWKAFELESMCLPMLVGTTHFGIFIGLV